ncbi:MAG: YibE/F family protein [Candidatus Saganbacteria bacterium]|nr:YibE/F family protein [Candidatus Saganbacteria bacterium]
MFRKVFVPIVLFCLSAVPVLAEQAPARPDYVKARVLAVELFNNELAGAQFNEISQQVRLRIESGKFSGGEITVDHMASGMMGPDMMLKPGDRVMLYVDEYPLPAESPDGAPIFHVADYYRAAPVYWLAFLYAVLLVILGGRKGIKSLISLVLTIALIFLVLFPLTLKGFNPLLVSVSLAAFLSLMVFRIIGGRSIKSLSAALGTLIGVTFAGILSYIFGRAAHLTGLSSEESRILLYSLDLKMDYQGLLFGSILIGALGAIMDVGMSIASAIAEVKRVHPEADMKLLFTSGINVGRDVMGTMSNTLILAYTGSALPLLLLLMANQVGLSKIINLEMITVEAVRALAGSIGLILCIPLTAMISAYLYTRGQRD